MEMSTANAPQAGARSHPGARTGAEEAFWILRFGFTVAPIVAGLDKFLNLLVDWERYVAPVATEILPLSPAGLMVLVGPVEIAAGVLVALKPRIGGYVVAAWLGAIIVNLLLAPGFLDIALRDLGLALGALALARLAGDRERRAALA